MIKFRLCHHQMRNLPSLEMGNVNHCTMASSLGRMEPQTIHVDKKSQTSQNLTFILGQFECVLFARLPFIDGPFSPQNLGQLRYPEGVPLSGFHLIQFAKAFKKLKQKME